MYQLIPQSIFLHLTRVDLFQLAEEQGFEPWMPLGMLVFKTSAFNRSATPPVLQALNSATALNSGMT